MGHLAAARIALAGVAVFLGALAVCMWLVGLHVHHAYAAAIACHPIGSAACSGLGISFDTMEVLLFNGYPLLAVPALIGAFLGAPVLARELETGTFRYAWTQGFGRWRWTLAKLVSPAVAVTAAAGALSVLFSWYYSPYLSARNQALALNGVSPLANLFALRGVAFAAWTLAAFAIGVLAGMLISQVVRAIAATLAVYAGLAPRGRAVPAPAPLDTAGRQEPPQPAIFCVDRQPVVDQGRQVRVRRAAPLSLVQQVCPGLAAGQGNIGTLGGCLSHHGYTQWTSYQPASRFWPFQWIEGGWLLALFVLLIAATVWLVSRREA